jgi:cephalosporin hydroxylase
VSIVEDFHALWYASAGASQVLWQGHPVLKNPFDLWIYQEIIFERQPDILIETGTHHGGSALFFAATAKLMDHSLRILTIDFNPKIGYDPQLWGIEPVVGISTTTGTHKLITSRIEQITRLLGRQPRVMIVLDSDHEKKNVLEELRLYTPFVTVGDYAVVEDTNVNGHPVFPTHGPGPFEAVEEFLRNSEHFERDHSREKFLLTFNPRGWLRRVA